MSDTVTPIKAHPTCSALRGALYIFEAAAIAGLPIPTHVTTSSYAAIRFDGSTSVSFQPDSLDDLHRWADYLGASIRPVPNGDTVQHWVDAEVFDQAVSLCFIEHLPKPGPVETYECSTCGAAFGIAGGYSSDEDYEADDYFAEQVRYHEAGECAR